MGNAKIQQSAPIQYNNIPTNSAVLQKLIQ